MFNKVSVLVPTRGRVERLVTLLSSYRHTTYGHESELVFRCDQDDLETQMFLKGERLHNERPKVVSGPRLEGYRSLPVFFNECAEAATGNILMLGNDDMIFRTMEWPSYLITAANKFPDGLFDLGVRTLNEDHYPFATTSRRVVQILGHIADPAIFWCDIYIRDVMQHFGRCIKVSEVEIAHDWAGTHPDKTFLEGTRNPAADNPHYWSTDHPQAVGRAIAKLQKLVGVAA
jgi:hypothetical protein